VSNVFAKAPPAPPAGHRWNPRVTPGKLYPVFNDDGRSFNAILDDGREAFCLWQRCAYLDDREEPFTSLGNWERIEDSRAQGIEAEGGDAASGSVHESPVPRSGMRPDPVAQTNKGER
jgi:hypothetical protein